MQTKKKRRRRRRSIFITMEISDSIIIDDSSLSSIDEKEDIPNNIPAKLQIQPKTNVRKRAGSSISDEKNTAYRPKLSFSNKKKRIIRDFDSTGDLKPLVKSPPHRRSHIPCRKSTDKNIWDQLSTSFNSDYRKTNSTDNVPPQPLASLNSPQKQLSVSTTQDLNESLYIDDESDDEQLKLEQEVLSLYAPKIKNQSKFSCFANEAIDDSQTPPEQKLVYKDTTQFQFYQRPPSKLKPLKGGVLERFEKHMNGLKSDTALWIHGRQNFLVKPGKLIKVKSVENVYGRRVITYINVVTGLEYFIFTNINDKLIQKLDVGQRVEFDVSGYTKRRMQLQENVKVNLDFEVTNKVETTCNVLLNMHKIKMHNS